MPHIVEVNTSVLKMKLYGRFGNKQSGFTLIELAIVLIILGILVALGAALVGPLTKRSKYDESREVVKSAKEAVLGYVVKNGYLPADLETAGARKLDAWGNDLVFYRATEFDASPEDACGVIATTLGGQPFEVRECTNDACSTYNTKSNIGFVVFSKGPDANEAGTDPNKDGIPPFYVRIQDSTYLDGGTTYYYDDIVQYAALDEIRSLRGCPQRLVITSPTTLTDGTEDSFYSYEMQATGGRSPYSWSITGQTINTLGCTGNSYPLANPNSGLCLYRDSGIISGTLNYCCSSGCPTTCSTNTGELTACSASISVSAQVTDSAGSTPVSYSGTITVRPKPLSITTAILPDAKTGVAYSRTLQGSGGRSSYTWSTGQAQGACPAGTVQIVATNIGLCLNTTTGVLSSPTYPTAAGTYNFTVTLNDTCTTTSQAFILNVIDSCFVSGINLVNTTGASRYFKRNVSTTGATGCSTAWANNANLNSHSSASGGIQPYDTYYFFSNAGCTTRVCTTTFPTLGAISYSTAQSLDANDNCQVGATLTDATCTFTDP